MGPQQPLDLRNTLSETGHLQRIRTTQRVHDTQLDPEGLAQDLEHHLRGTAFADTTARQLMLMTARLTPRQAANLGFGISFSAIDKLRLKNITSPPK